ncbi:MAG: PDZ domain-containing protein [Kofleriaceae bacterium]
MASFPRRTHLLIALAVVGVAILAAVMVRRHQAPAAKPAAVATGADPWGAGQADSPRAGRPLAAVAASLGLRARPAGPPVTVTGTVRLMPAGTPVAGAEVAFMSDTGENTATADDQGFYTIQVASGIRWRVHARSENAVGAPEGFVASSDNAHRDLEVRPTAIVRGRVVDIRGQAVSGATVNVEVAADDRGLLEAALPMSTTADAGGRFELVSVPGALKVRGSRGLAQGVTVVEALAPGATLEVELRLLDPITVTGRVVDGAGAPVAGAKILAAATISTGGPTERLQFDAADDGSFTAVTPAGWLRLEARKGGDLSPAIAQWIGSGERRDDQVLVLTPPVTLTGKVITTAGTPVVGARVRLVANAVYDTITGSNGTFDIGAPGTQPYTVKVKHTDGEVVRDVAAWTGEEVFVMRQFGTVHVVVPGVSTEVTVAIDGFVADGDAAARAPAVASFRGPGGQVTLSNLVPGRYDLTVAAEGAGAVRVPRVVVDDGASRELKVALTPAVVVRGVVKTGAQPVAAAQVSIGGRTVFTDAKGRFAVPDVATGPVSVAVIKTGFATAWAGAMAGPDAAPVAIDLRPADGTGVVDGIGVVLAPAPAGAVVAQVLPGSPADGKVRPGDVIAAIDGTDVAAAAMDDIVARLRGSAGSSVTLTLGRGADTTAVDVVRKRLVVPPGSPPVALAQQAAPGGARC